MLDKLFCVMLLLYARAAVFVCMCVCVYV